MDVTISYALAAAGAGILLVALVYQIRKGINVDLANAQLLKLVRANNVDRMIKLCEAVSGTYLDAIRAAAQAGKTVAATGGDVGAAVTEAFEATAKPLVHRWRRAFEGGLLGALLVGAGVGVALTADAAVLPRPLLTIAGLAGIATIRIVIRSNDLERACTSARTDILPPLAAAIIENAKRAS